MRLLNFGILGVDEPFAIYNKQGNKRITNGVSYVIIILLFRGRDEVDFVLITQP